MSKPVKTIKSILDLTPDQENINARTRRSYNEIDESMGLGGFGRPMLVDAQGNIIAGNGQTDVLMDRYEGEPPEPIVIQSDGTRPIIHQRTDLDLYDETDERARALSYYDNATTRHGRWDRDMVAVARSRGRDLRRIFTDEELEELLKQESRDNRSETTPQLRAKTYHLSVACKDEDDLQSLSQRLMDEGYNVTPVIKGV